MPKIQYKEIRFNKKTLDTIEAANIIINEYRRNGLDLTLRQLYYQFVSRDLIPNNDKEYKRLGEIVSDGRMAGLIDWRAIVDRTRNLRAYGGYDSPQDAIERVAGHYHRHLWEGQDNYVEVWVEKDALIGVIQNACAPLDTPHFSCRGYTSASEMWEAAQRLRRRADGIGGNAVVIHLGDHDPSGIDMTRDIQDRLELFAEMPIEVRRLALNMAQIEELKPPPNPAKTTDSRHQGYVARFGHESWELDAIEPRRMSNLIRSTIEEYLDLGQLALVKRRTQHEADQLQSVYDNFDEVRALDFYPPDFDPDEAEDGEDDE